jgi:hypothetical protein
VIREGDHRHVFPMLLEGRRFAATGCEDVKEYRGTSKGRDEAMGSVVVRGLLHSGGRRAIIEVRPYYPRAVIVLIFAHENPMAVLFDPPVHRYIGVGSPSKDFKSFHQDRGEPCTIRRSMP